MAVLQPLLVIVDEPGPYITVLIKCGRCREIVARRRYDSRSPDAELQAPIDALLDADVALAHLCPGLN